MNDLDAYIGIAAFSSYSKRLFRIAQENAAFTRLFGANGLPCLQPVSKSELIYDQRRNGMRQSLQSE